MGCIGTYDNEPEVQATSLEEMETEETDTCENECACNCNCQ